MTVNSDEANPVDVWSHSEKLSSRVKKLRKQFYSFDERTETNEPYAFSTGAPWDQVYSYHDWANEPALYMFLAFSAMAIDLELPDDFWDHSLPMRRAIVFHEAMTHYMPTRILDGEMIVGFHFNTALSRALNKNEAKKRNKEMNKWFKEASRLNEFGVGTASAPAGHIIPNYAKVLRIGFRGLVEEYENILKQSISPEHREFVEALILTCTCCQPEICRGISKAG